MFEYFKDFKNERIHDEYLIRTIEILSNIERIDIFEKLLQIEKGQLGSFNGGYKKRDFDILLEFQNANVIIETKVDSAEGYYQDPAIWQSEKIFQKYSTKWESKKVLFIFLTYGLSEFYIKYNDKSEFGSGPYNTKFQHIGCKDIHRFLNEVCNPSGSIPEDLKIWNESLNFELLKREKNKKFLNHVNEILKLYKAPLQLTDYPVNRLNIYLPEFTVPFYYELCNAWNKKQNKLIGKACLYPVGRMYSPVNDSVLNFRELWNSKVTILTCGGVLEKQYLYFEFNEDFNLHLKAEMVTPKIDVVKKLLTLNTTKLSCGFNSITENYQQGAHVLFEWDLNILSNSIEENLNAIENVITNAINVLR